MGKKPKSRETIRAKFAKKRPSNYWERTGGDKKPAGLDTIEQTTAVCELICEGYPVAEILELLKKRYGKQGVMSREHVYDLLHHAADEGWLEFRPPEHHEFEKFLIQRYDWLTEAHVVHTSTHRDVARRTARVVFSLLLQHANREEVHVGLAGGISVRSVMSALARLLCGPIPAGELPRRVVFHSLVSGFDRRDPTTDPTSFFTFFVDVPALKIEPHFVGLFAPAVVPEKDHQGLMRLVKESRDEAKDLDIVVTSGSDWRDDHSLLRRALAMEKGSASLAMLESEGCVGDLLCQPIADDGPITTPTPMRAFTLIELEQLATMVENGKHVVLMLGPCAGCREPKGELLRTVLEQERHHATHVITDTRSAGEVYAYFLEHGRVAPSLVGGRGRTASGGR